MSQRRSQVSEYRRASEWLANERTFLAWIRTRVTVISFGCAIGALEGEPFQSIKALRDEFGDTGRCMLIGGGRASPYRAAFFNSAPVRYLDFNDRYVAR